MLMLGGWGWSAQVDLPEFYEAEEGPPSKRNIFGVRLEGIKPVFIALEPVFALWLTQHAHVFLT